MPYRRRPSDVLLKPGEYFVGDEHHRIRTVLGSCVSVTLWCPARRIGAMSHYMLACRPPTGPQDAEPSGRYGEDALALMLSELERRGVRRSQCEAKVFGGGQMFSGVATSGQLDVGRRNGEAARLLLRAHGIALVSESLFGQGHRQILFDVATGHVWCRQVRPVPQTVNGSL